MKKYIILVMSLMIISNFAWAKSKRQMTAVNLGDQEVTLMSQATRSGERILIISDQKCGANDLCYQNKTIEGMIRVYQKSDQARYAQFYAVQNRRLQWTMMLMQEWQDYGRVDVFIDRVSDRHASAWTAYQPYDCGHQGEADTPDFDLSQVEDLLDATIYPMDEIFGTQLEAKEMFAGLQSAVEIEQLISEEMSQDVSESTVTSMATAVTIYTTGRGVFNTVYGYTQKQNTFTNNKGTMGLGTDHVNIARSGGETISRALRSFTSSSSR